MKIHPSYFVNACYRSNYECIWRVSSFTSVMLFYNSNFCWKQQTDSPFIRFCRISVLPLSECVGICQSLFSVNVWEVICYNLVTVGIGLHLSVQCVSWPLVHHTWSICFITCFKHKAIAIFTCCTGWQMIWFSCLSRELAVFVHLSWVRLLMISHKCSGDKDS